MRTVRNPARQPTPTQVKKTASRLSALEFLGRDFVKVRKFGKATHVLQAWLVPPGIRMNRQLSALLASRIGPLGREISRRLAPVMARGWLRLTPRQYNLVALVKSLADRLADFDFSRLDMKNRRAVDRLRVIENLFLLLHRDPQCIPIISTALARVELSDVMGPMLQLLAEDCMFPSLYRCILGLNMFKYRRYLQLGDLLPDEPAVEPDRERFQLDQAARRQVDELVGWMRESLSILHSQLAEARRISGYVPPDGSGVATLAEAYDASFPGPVSSFQTDLQDLAVFAVRLIASFRSVFSPLLVNLVSSSTFAPDFAKLHAFSERLETDFRRTVRVPLHRYLRIRDGGLQAIGEEAEISQLVGNVAGSFVDLGRKVLDILDPRSPAAAELDVLHDDQRLSARSLVNGLTVKEALAKVVEVSFCVGVLLKDSILTMILSREKRLTMEIEARMTFLKRVLDPQKYQEILEHGDTGARNLTTSELPGREEDPGALRYWPGSGIVDGPVAEGLPPRDSR